MDAKSAVPIVPAPLALPPQHIFIAWQWHALRQKQIDTYKCPPRWAHMTHFKQTIKGHFRLFKILRKDWFPWRSDGRPVAAH